MDSEEWLRGAEEALRETRADWDLAEDHVKLAELVDGEAIIPSINELRYAGRRLIDALTAIAAGDVGRANGFLGEARFFCLRARHDALDATLLTISGDVKNKLDHLDYEVIAVCFAPLPELRTALHRASNAVAKSRGNREDRDLIYKTVATTDFPRLVELYQEFSSSQDLMVRMTKRRRWTSFLTNCFGIAGMIALLIAIYDHRDFILDLVHH